MKEQYGRDFTAQPYGINTVGAFPFIFDIMLPIAAPWGADLGLETAWKVGCASNFIVGIINVVLGCLFLFKPVGDFILMYVPVASFCIPVAGVGLTWLALNQIAPNFASPIAGFIPVFMVFVMYWSGPNGSPIKISGIKFPNVLHWIIPGLILGLIFKLAPVMQPGYEYNYPGGGIYIGGDCFEGLSQVGSYFGIILPLAFVATMGDIMSLVTAFNAGDPYPIAETLIVDGLFTMLGAILGSPFGTVVYFGHPVHKKLGGKYAYSFLNGVIYLILCLSGVFGLIVDVSPKVMVGPTIMVFGVYLGQECCKFMPRRHHGIIFFTLFFAFCDYFVTGHGVGASTVEGIGVNIMKRGALLNCMLWSGMLSYAMDCRWIPAAVFAAVAAVFSFFGIIHQNSINLEILTTGTMEDLSSGTTADPATGVGYWYMSSPLQCFIGYLPLVVTCLVWHVMQNSSAFEMPKPIMPGSEAAMESEAAEEGFMLFSIGKLDNWWAKGPADGATKAVAEA